MITISPPVGAPGEPVLEAAGRSVGEIVSEAYEKGHDRVAAAHAIAESDVLEAARYCAERACEGAGAFCRVCRLWAEGQGLKTLDDFLARYAEVAISNSPLSISSLEGRGRLEAPSLEALAKTWSGQEIWFLARRLLRRVERKQQGAFKSLSMKHKPAPTVVLVEPQMADNIGMVARAMANFELDSLRLVSPRDGWPNAKAEAAASGAQAIVHEAQAFATLKEAIGDQHWVAATTARPRHLAKPVLTPQEAAVEMDRRIAEGENAAIVFGPERTGLSTDHVSLADAIVMAPVSPDFASLNLSQAVLLLGYEWMKLRKSEGIGRRTPTERGSKAGLDLGSPPATKEQVLGLIDHLESELESTDHFRPPEKRPIMMRNLRSVFERMALSQQEVRTLRGIVSSLTRNRRS